MSLKAGLIPLVHPLAASLISGSGVVVQLLIASLLAAAAILGWSSIFSPLQLKSQVEISKISCVWAVRILLSSSVTGLQPPGIGILVRGAVSSTGDSSTLIPRGGVCRMKFFFFVITRHFWLWISR